jgi:phosphonate ABC transporter permease subunit PhnE
VRMQNVSASEKQKKRELARIWKSSRLGILIVLGLVVYAYGFDVVRVDLDEFRKESRKESRERVARALARPDIFEFDREEFISSAAIMAPCPTSAGDSPATATLGQGTIAIDPACADPGTEVRITGSGFTPGSDGPISFIPSSNPDHEIALQMTRIEVDRDGIFGATVELPERPSDETQYVRVTTRQNVGAPRFSDTAKSVWEKIIETVFLALLATTLGTILAVPLSFLASRNLMADVKSPIASIALSLLGWPLGAVLGFAAVSLASSVADLLPLTSSLSYAGLFLLPPVVFGSVRVAQSEATKSTLADVRIVGILVMAVTGLVGIFLLYLIAGLAILFGEGLMSRLGESTQFIGNFFFVLGDILRTIIPLIGAVTGAFIVGNLGGTLGQSLTERLQVRPLRTLNLVLSAVAGAALLLLIAAALNWLFEIDNPVTVYVLPIVAGAALGLFLAARTKPKDTLAIGYAIYYSTRTVLNAVRSIEPLIMAIVAVIWVGIGPFAGMLALALHTVASLGKLYSEQVESIQPGPVEAVTATGANRLQMIVYGVVPQIIPPFISFTMYRWDINVRMSTIIGFAGGGGIGFLLQQSINLLDYRAASTAMLAIAIVVATMDFVSSTLRQRFV